MLNAFKGSLFFNRRSFIKMLRIMSITATLLLTCFLQVGARASSQEITINVKGAPLNKVFQEIKRQTGYTFIYSETMLKVPKKVSMNVRNSPLQEVLSICFASQPFTYKIINKTIVVQPKKKTFQNIRSFIEAPQAIVKGKVTDSATGRPLVGATIRVKGSVTATTTDERGQFSLDVPDNAVLEVSYVGYDKKEISANGRTSINISLSISATELNPLVIVGYGTKRQSELSSSVSVVNEKDLKGVTSSDLGTMLQGKVPGLVVSSTIGRPGSSTDLVIRGVGSVGAGHAPLFVVDGLIGSTFDPNNVASVTVLKDAAATGLYGSRAANGVIIITTKSGQVGNKVSYSGSFGPTELQRGHIRMMNSAELYASQKMGYRNFYDDRVAANDPNFTNRSFDQYLETVLPSSLLNTNTDWQSLLSRTGYVNMQQLSVSGGNDKTTFYISGNYFRELGTILSTSFQRMDLRVNLKHKISDRFTLYAKINGGTDKQPNEPLGGQEGTMNQYYNNMPWDPAYEPDGVTPYNPLKPGNPWIGNATSNYFYNVEHQSDITKDGHVDAALQLDAKITGWMTFSTNNRFGLSGTDHTQLLDKDHQLASFDNGRVTQNYSYRNSFITSNTLHMSHSFGKHNLSGVFGQEYSSSTNTNTEAVGVDIAEGLSALSAAGSASQVSGNKVESTFLSYFGQIDYNYMSRYFLVGSARRDASSLFGVNNRWAPFYSIGGSWLLSNEDFLENVSWIDLLKVRGSYGTTGNASIPAYLSLGTFIFSNSTTYAGNAGAQPARIPNPDLTWETAHTTNIGFELSIFKRFKFEFDIYNRINKNLLQDVPLSAASGFSNQRKNVGSIRNRGIDLSLFTENLRGKLKWETQFNINFNRNKVLILNEGEDIANENMRIREGLPLNYFYMKKWAGVDPQTGKALWVRWEDKDGNLINGSDEKEPAEVLTTNVYNQASNLFIRSAYPDFTGGIRNDITYNNFSFSVLCNFVADQSIYNAARQRRDADGNSLNQDQMKLDKGWSRWQKPGDNATHPRFVSGGGSSSNNTSSRYLENAGYFRIQNVRLDYTFSHPVAIFSRLSIYASIDNLAVFTKYSGADPGVDIENPTVDQGSDNSSYTATRRLMLGVSLDL